MHETGKKIRGLPFFSYFSVCVKFTTKQRINHIFSYKAHVVVVFHKLPHNTTTPLKTVLVFAAMYTGLVVVRNRLARQHRLTT